MKKDDLKEIKLKFEKTNYEIRKIINDLTLVSVNGSKKIDIDRLIPRLEKILEN